MEKKRKSNKEKSSQSPDDDDRYLIKMKCPTQRTEITFSRLIYGPLKLDCSFSFWGPYNCQCHIWIRVIWQKGFINHDLKERKSSKVKKKKGAGKTNRILFSFAIFEFRIHPRLVILMCQKKMFYQTAFPFCPRQSATWHFLVTPAIR